jgi:hypothetical protein
MIAFIEDVTVLSDNELLNYSKKLAHDENSIGLRIVECLREAEKRMLFAQMGMSSLWEFATQYLGLSQGNAHLKIAAMRLTRDFEIAKDKVERGELSITNAAKVNTFFRQEQKTGHVLTFEQKTEVIQSVAGLSQSQCERVLLSLAPGAIPVEKVRAVTDTMTEIKMVVDQGTLEVLERLRELVSHKMPNATYAELLDYLAREKVKDLEKKQMGTSPVSDFELDTETVKPTYLVGSTGEVTQTSAAPVSAPTPRKYISVVDRRWVMRRAMGQCEHTPPDGRRCTSRWQLELDHICPLALGGKNERTNYRIVCKKHNLYHAHVSLGSVMKEYAPSLR